VESVLCGDLKEPADLLCAPRCPLHTVVTRRRVYGQDGVHREMSTAHGVAKRLGKRDVNVPDGLASERLAAASPSLAESSVEPVQVPGREPLERDLADVRHDPRLDDGAVGVPRRHREIRVLPAGEPLIEQIAGHGELGRHDVGTTGRVREERRSGGLRFPLGPVAAVGVLRVLVDGEHVPSAVRSASDLRPHDDTRSKRSMFGL
jgi:hypothetical protein